MYGGDDRDGADDHGQGDEPAREPPRTIITTLSDDQLATLAMIGEPELRRQGSALYLEDAPAGITGLSPEISVHVIKQYMCPVVNYRGRERMIMPNGDIHEIR